MRCVDFFSGSAWSLSVFHTASHMGLGTRSSFFAGRQSWRLASKVAGVGLGGDSGAPLAVQASLHTCLPSLSHLRCLGQTPGSSMVPRVLSCFCNDVQIRGEPSPPSPSPHCWLSPRQHWPFCRRLHTGLWASTFVPPVFPNTAASVNVLEC